MVRLAPVLSVSEKRSRRGRSCDRPPRLPLMPLRHGQSSLRAYAVRTTQCSPSISPHVLLELLQLAYRCSTGTVVFCTETRCLLSSSPQQKAGTCERRAGLMTFACTAATQRACHIGRIALLLLLLLSFLNNQYLSKCIALISFKLWLGDQRNPSARNRTEIYLHQSVVGPWSRFEGRGPTEQCCRTCEHRTKPPCNCILKHKSAHRLTPFHGWDVLWASLHTSTYAVV